MTAREAGDRDMVAVSCRPLGGLTKHWHLVLGLRSQSLASP